MNHGVDDRGTLTTEIQGTRVRVADPNRALLIETGKGDTVTSIEIQEQTPEGTWLTAARIHLREQDASYLALAMAAHALRES
jgi:hypothetical protein